VSGQPLLAWDVGTGSGAIAVALAVEVRRRGYANDVRLLATDMSAAALSLATENAVAHGVADLIDLAVADLTDGVETRPVDLLLANLPYVPASTVPELPIAASFEPVNALDGGDDGLDLVRRLIGELPTALAAEGVALMEIGAGQESTVEEYARDVVPAWDVTCTTIWPGCRVWSSSLGETDREPADLGWRAGCDRRSDRGASTRRGDRHPDRDRLRRRCAAH
jgi:HemK-like putative methylase